MFVFAGVVAAALSVRAQGDIVQGLATVGTTKVGLSAGMAVGYKGPNGALISVVLADNAVDLKAFGEDTRTGAGEALVPGLFMGAWKAQHFAKKLAGVTFTIGPDGVVDDEFLIGGRGHTFSVGDYVLTLKSRSPRLVGTIKTKAPAVDLGNGKSAGLDALFELAITAR
jgi:hypothetical protein